MANPYAGTAITTTATFTTPDSAVAVDPTTVTLKFQVAGGSTTTWTYGSVGSIAEIGIGVYSAELDTTGNPGNWTVEWIGTGICAAVGVSTFTIQAAPL